MTPRDIYEEDIRKKLVPSSTEDILRTANDPKRLSELGMSRGQLLQFGTNLKSAREREDEMASRLGGGLGGGGFTPTSAQQAYDISKNPDELRKRGISAQSALRFGQRMLEEEEEEEGMRGSLSEMIGRQKQRKLGMSAFSQQQPSFGGMVGNSMGRLFSR